MKLGVWLFMVLWIFARETMELFGVLYRNGPMKGFLLYIDVWNVIDW
jgi:hypothetical protein